MSTIVYFSLLFTLKLNQKANQKQIQSRTAQYKQQYIQHLCFVSPLLLLLLPFLLPTPYFSVQIKDPAEL